MKKRIGQSLNGTRNLLLAAAAMMALTAPIVIGLMNAPSVLAQFSGEVAEKFEVASIRACDENADVRGGGGNASPGRLTLRCQTVRGLISAAFQMWANGQLNPPYTYSELEGGPSWITSSRYTITAKAADNVPRGIISGPMMQALLKDRFGLKIHSETREVPVYALTVARGGNKMRRVEEGSCTQTDLSRAMEKPDPGAKPPYGGQKLLNGPNEVWQATV